MKNKNKKEKIALSASAERELELLGKHCKIDKENKIISYQYHVKNVDEIVDENIGDVKHPKINDEFLNKLSDFAHSVPEPYTIDWDIVVDNYGPYKHKDLIEAISDSLEIFNYNYSQNKKSEYIKMSLLLAFGIIIFSWLFIICSFNLFADSDITHNIVHECVYTVACVILWEGIYIFFLPTKSYKDVSYTLLRRINHISLLNKNKQKVITKSFADIKAKWVEDSKPVRHFKRIFLATSVGYLCLGLASLPEIFLIIKLIEKIGMYAIGLIVVNAVMCVVVLLTAISNLALYYEYGKIRKYATLFNFLSTAFVFGTFAFRLYLNITYLDILSTFGVIILGILVLISIGCTIETFVFNKLESKNLKKLHSK